MSSFVCINNMYGMSDERYNKQVYDIPNDSVGNKVTRSIIYSNMPFLGIDDLSSKLGDIVGVATACSCIATMHVGSL